MSARRRLAALTAVAVFTLALTATVAIATTSTKTATLDGVTATLTVTGSSGNFQAAHLAISKSGQQLYSQPVKSRYCTTACAPSVVRNYLSVTNLGTGSPDVILQLFTRGANCCFVDQVFQLDSGTMTYRRTEHDFASAGALIKRLSPGHRWAFISDDENFKYKFTDGASSGAPIQIWRYSPGKFTIVTKQYPKLIKSDAATWLRVFKHSLSNGDGFIAAWAGDEELLGHDKLVQSTLATEARRGDLRDGNFGAPTGKKFIRALNKLLRKLGYEHTHRG